MKKKFLYSKKAMTFVEVLISMAILTIIVAAMQQIFAVGEKTWRRDIEQIQLQQEARRALDDMVSELRASTAITITAVMIRSIILGFEI